MKPLIVLSLPNSGTTWFCGLLAKHSGLKYSDEYFNPVLNHLREVELRKVFGSELACCYRNIATGSSSEVESIISATWPRDGYELTKDNYSPFKLESFQRFFRCVILLRHTAGVFPPSRIRVWSFYEHAWQALKDAGHDLHEVSLRARAMEAHVIMARQMRADSARLGIPVVYYEDLFDGQRAKDSLQTAGLTFDGLLQEICETRRAKRIVWDSVY